MTKNTAYHTYAILADMYAEAAAGRLDIDGDMDDWFGVSADESEAVDGDAVYDALQDHERNGLVRLAHEWLEYALAHGDEGLYDSCNMVIGNDARDAAYCRACAVLCEVEAEALASGARDDA